MILRNLSNAVFKMDISRIPGCHILWVISLQRNWTIRALRKYLEDISDDEIAGMNIPTGVPLVYHLNEDFTVDHVGYLGDEDIIRAKIDAVKMQSVRTEEEK